MPGTSLPTAGSRGERPSYGYQRSNVSQASSDSAPEALFVSQGLPVAWLEGGRCGQWGWSLRAEFLRKLPFQMRLTSYVLWGRGVPHG